MAQVFWRSCFALGARGILGPGLVGEVPMSAPPPSDESLIEKLLAHLKAEEYSLRIQHCYSLAYGSCWSATAETRWGSRPSARSTSRNSCAGTIGSSTNGTARCLSVSTPFQKWRHRYTGSGDRATSDERPSRSIRRPNPVGLHAGGAVRNC
jgi:hypothetical protein